MKTELKVIDGDREALQEQLMLAIFFDREKIAEIESKLLPRSRRQLTLVSSKQINDGDSQGTMVPVL